MRILVFSMLVVVFALGPYASAFAGDGVTQSVAFDKVFRVDSRP
jgi:hypothetical protein